MTKTVRSVCPYWGVGCGIVMKVADDRIVKVRGDKSHSANFGCPCTKGSSCDVLAFSLTGQPSAMGGREMGYMGPGFPGHAPPRARRTAGSSRNCGASRPAQSRLLARPGGKALRPASRDLGRRRSLAVDGGRAHVYVCGDAARMAKDVDAALKQVVADHGGMRAEAAADYVAQMQKERRYVREVY